jgi:hypothetical protein
VRLNPNTGTWELEDDSPLAVRSVEEGPRAAYTQDTLDTFWTNAGLAVVIAAYRKRMEQAIQHAPDGTPFVDSFTQVWQEVLDDVVTNLQGAIEKRWRDEATVP